MTRDRLMQLLNYSPETGEFTWATKQVSHLPGEQAGSKDLKGYMRIGLDGKLYKAHRLAWLWMTGEFPQGIIDHIDGNKSNNSWINLRECSVSENNSNSKKRKHNKCEYKRWCPASRAEAAERELAELKRRLAEPDFRVDFLGRDG